MRFLIFSAMPFLAACATSTTVPPSEPVRSSASVGQIVDGDLIGLTANELGQRFGQPRLNIREGVGTKLQFVSPSCILDAYLYLPPSGTGVARVTHVDTRDGQGRDVDRRGCIAAIAAR
ncbi:MAG TPA: hypothetical protein VNA29_08270 [Sphingomicrobium sp.]|nr:hypothetical protein [Sphingomicrobium sp.]